MTLLVRQNIYAAWLDGDETATAALRALCMDLGEIESDLEPLTKAREATRDQISHVLSTMDGEKAEIKGFGSLKITQAAVTEGYDKKKLDALLHWLLDNGYTDIAERLSACRTKSMRAGGLRIEREKHAPHQS